PPPPPPPPPPPRISKRVVKAAKAILDFKKTIANGPKEVLDSWKGLDACKYKGVTCDKIPDFDNERAVAGIDFNGYGFEGKGGQLKLEGFIERLEDLAFFHANSNNFTGMVPDIDLKKIRFLYEFDLSNNKLSGEFPYKVLAAKNLTFLDLRFNQFYGQVPNEIFTLDVQVIFINNNNFLQNLPSNLGQTPALYLTFANNEFTGQIPGSIGLASETLIEVLFLNNKLSGCLPYEIGLLKKTTLFDASQNKITGPIPQSFACLKKIEILNLASNHLYGEVPELVCKLPNLQNLSLSDNYFTQVGTLCRKLIMQKRLNVRNNCIFDLPNQRPKEECERFFTKNPKTCSQNKMMYYIPCTRQWAYQGSELSDGRQLFASYDDGDDHDHDHDSGRGSSSPVLYGALTPNGLRI
ncbi:uncharacterized protein At4g06744-like, partial [Morus notabilis]|uniref:uncharacterized protein At4g06744-like n=1 Tax=Morus notabilis TaxID=981085 RepID=UPI000CED74BC